MKVVLYWRKLLIRPDSVKRVIDYILANNIRVDWVSKIVSIFDKLKLGDPRTVMFLSFCITVFYRVPRIVATG